MLTRSFYTILVVFLTLCAQAQTERCQASKDRVLWWQQHPDAYEQWLQQNDLIDQWVALNNHQMGLRGVVTIPVVVHVVWNKPEENISNEQILSQIKALNEDFRALNKEIPLIPSVFQPLIADVEISFCLASVDPDGNPTTGITRTFTNNSVGIGGTAAIHYTALGGHDAWDPQRYLNIWVAKFAGGISGTATFPGQGPPAEDGVEINYRYFGTINTEPPYHLGRTLTHEVGHYFNLEHPWGPSITDCCGDDFVADTPPACQTYLGQCPVHPQVSCVLPDIFMDYMFYTDDSCMGMFTLGQKARMLAALELFRPGLLLGGDCVSATTSRKGSTGLTIAPNPAHTSISITPTGGIVLGNADFILYDMMGRVVMNGQLDPGRTQWLLNVSKLDTGWYALTVTGQRFHASARFLKK